jgi:hypothetical protein
LEEQSVAEESSVTASDGKKHEEFRTKQDIEYISDFDQFLKQLPKRGGGK